MQQETASTAAGGDQSIDRNSRSPADVSFDQASHSRHELELWDTVQSDSSVRLKADAAMTIDKDMDGWTDGRADWRNDTSRSEAFLSTRGKNIRTPVCLPICLVCMSVGL